MRKQTIQAQNRVLGKKKAKEFRGHRYNLDNDEVLKKITVNPGWEMDIPQMKAFEDDVFSALPSPKVIEEVSFAAPRKPGLIDDLVEWRRSHSINEADSLSFFQGEGNFKSFKKWAGSKGKNDHFAMMERHINTIIERRAKFNGEIYRGVALSDKELSALKVGGSIENKSFTSFSANETVAKRFAEMRRNEGHGVNRVVFRLKNRSGVDVTALHYELRGEKEVLHQMGRKYRVKKIAVRRATIHKQRREYTEIILEEINPKDPPKYRQRLTQVEFEKADRKWLLEKTSESHKRIEAAKELAIKYETLPVTSDKVTGWGAGVKNKFYVANGGPLEDVLDQLSDKVLHAYRKQVKYPPALQEIDDILASRGVKVKRVGPKLINIDKGKRKQFDYKRDEYFSRFVKERKLIEALDKFEPSMIERKIFSALGSKFDKPNAAVRKYYEKVLAHIKAMREGKIGKGAKVVTTPVKPKPIPKGKKKVTPKPKPKTKKVSTKKVVSGEIEDVLEQLDASTDPAEKKRLRAKLRKLGHKGGVKKWKPDTAYSTPTLTAQREIEQLLEELAVTADPKRKKSIRAKLRRMGHKGGVKGVKPPPSPTPRDAVIKPPEPVKPKKVKVESGPFKDTGQSQHDLVMGQVRQLDEFKALEREFGIKGKPIKDFQDVLDGTLEELAALWNQWRDLPLNSIEANKLRAKIEVMGNKLNAIRGGVSKVTALFDQEVMKLLEVAPQHRVKIKVTMAREGASPRQLKKLERMAEDAKKYIEKYVDRRVLGHNEMQMNVKYHKGRAFYRGRVLHINPSRDTWKTIVHEFGHHVENQNRRFDLNARSYIRGRVTAKELRDGPISLRKLTGNQKYEIDEVAFGDKFFNPYFGKQYTHGGTEATSMALEYIAESPSWLLNADRKTFEFAMRLYRYGQHIKI